MNRRTILSLAAGAALMLGVAGCGANGASPGGPAASGSTGSISPEVKDAIDGQVAASAIADRDHIYSTYAHCEAGDCRVRLAATADGGKTWAQRETPLPVFPATKPRVGALKFTLTGFGPLTLRLLSWNSRAAWITTDGGATWHEAPKAAPKSDTVPIGWHALDLAVTSVGGGDTYLVAGDPTTGQAGIVTLPKHVSFNESPPASPDKGFWLTGHSPKGIYVHSSADRGRTWLSNEVVIDESAGSAMINLVAADATTAYVSASRFTEQTTKPTSDTYRTTDGGKTWQHFTPKGLPATTRVESIAILPDRSLLALCGLNAAERTFHVSKDGGRTFTALSVTGYPAKGGNVAALPGGGYAAQLPASEMTVRPPFYLSDDGRTWRQIDVPVQ